MANGIKLANNRIHYIISASDMGDHLFNFYWVTQSMNFIENLTNCIESLPVTMRTMVLDATVWNFFLIFLNIEFATSLTLRIQLMLFIIFHFDN